MTPAGMLGWVLAGAVVLAWVRLLLGQRRAPAPGWRLALLMLLQPVGAGLLYLTLLPPALPTRAGTMTVLTAGTTQALVAAQATGATLVAMPEAPASVDAGPMPDLATALRQHPGISRLQVVGHGLDPRDRDAARGYALEFGLPPLPAGLVRLDAATRAVPGAAFSVNGRVHAVEGGRVRLLDPAAQEVDGADLDAAGGFRLRGYARAPGLADFTLQVLDVDGREVDAAPVPVQVADDPPPRVLLLVGAPNPEFRHLRRWATDAGLDLHVEVAVGGGMGLGDGPAPADAAGFAAFDLVILDDRALAGLGASRRAALAQALEAGTGVLLQATGSLSASVRSQMAALGMPVTGAAGAEGFTLPPVEDPAVLGARMGPGSEGAPFDPLLAQEAPPELARRTLQPQAGDAVVVPGTSTDPAFAWWRARGRGRVGLWTLTDSYRLVLAGRGDLHGESWSAAVSTLARPGTQAPPRFAAGARAGRRMVVCELDAAAAQVAAPDGSRTTILVDPGAGPAGCAAYWPATGGWHLLQMGDAGWPFHVRAAGEAPGLAAAALQEATLRLVGPGRATPVPGTTPMQPRRGPSWPWFLAWLASAGLLWWLERRRAPVARARSGS